MRAESHPDRIAPSIPASGPHRPAGHWILHERARAHYWEEPRGWLSVKSLGSGHAIYEAAGSRFLVDPRGYLVLNEGQPYIVTIDAPAPVESFCVFFAPQFAVDVARALTQSDGHLLDDPIGSASDPVRFFERVSPQDQLVTPVLRQLRGRHDAAATSEQIHLLMERLLIAREAVRPLVDRMPALRASTRAELFRRLSRARDFLDASIDRPVSLDATATVAGLSPHHFLRTFKQVYRETPHAYVTARRLDHACTLLATTRLPVTDVCLRIGFDSLGTFSTLFKRRVGLSPRTFREARQPGSSKIQEAAENVAG